MIDSQRQLEIVSATWITPLFQFASDAMASYHLARKVAYEPFPYVEAQLTSYFVLIAVGFIPLFMIEFVAATVFGFFLDLVTVMSFTGLHEVRLFGRRNSVDKACSFT